jgi:hypothetical protein
VLQCDRRGVCDTRGRRCVRGVRCRPVLPLSRRLPSTPSAADAPGFVRGFHRYYAPVRLLRLVHQRRRRLAFPLRTGWAGQAGDLPGSDGLLLGVMRSSTPAWRQHLAWRRRTSCLRCIQPARPTRCFQFRGSITHPTQLLCTLRRQRRRCRRNTRYQAGATPYLGRTSTGWIPPAFLAHWMPGSSLIKSGHGVLGSEFCAGN